MAGKVFAYTIGHSIYLNITNRCTNDCVFCIRRTKEGLGYDLWLEREPGLDELMKAMGDARQYREVVFCGYGEPLIRANLVIEASRLLKRQGAYIRIDTNGQAGLIHGRDIASELAGLVDAVSISMNAADSGQYVVLCRPQYGEKAYSALLEFAMQCRKYIPRVILSVVRWPGIDIERCREIARNMGADFKVRELWGTFTSF